MNVAVIPRGWIWQLRDSRGDGFFYGGNPTLNHNIRNDVITNALTRIDTYESVMYAFNLSRFIKIGVFLHSLKLTVIIIIIKGIYIAQVRKGHKCAKIKLRCGVFSVLPLWWLLLPPLDDKKYAGICGDGSNFLRGWIRTSARTGGDGCEVCGDGWGRDSNPIPVHTSTPHASFSFLQTGCPCCHPTNSVKALKAITWR